MPREDARVNGVAGTIGVAVREYRPYEPVVDSRRWYGTDDGVVVAGGGEHEHPVTLLSWPFAAFTWRMRHARRVGGGGGELGGNPLGAERIRGDGSAGNRITGRQGRHACDAPIGVDDRGETEVCELRQANEVLRPPAFVHECVEKHKASGTDGDLG